MASAVNITSSAYSPSIPILSRINPIPCIDTYSFKIHSNIVLHRLLHLKGLFPVDLPVKILKAFPIFFNSGYMTCPSINILTNK